MNDRMIRIEWRVVDMWHIQAVTMGTIIICRPIVITVLVLICHYLWYLLFCCWRIYCSCFLVGELWYLNPYPAKLIYLNVQTLEVVFRCSDLQVRVGENCSYLVNVRPTICIFCMFKHSFHSQLQWFNLLIKQIQTTIIVISRQNVNIRVQFNESSPIEYMHVHRILKPCIDLKNDVQR